MDTEGERFGCALCVLEHGARAPQIAELTWPPEALAEHIETEHHLIVARGDESRLDAEARYFRCYPERDCCRPVN